MQIKTIEKQLKAKLEEWLETITNEDLRKDVKKNLLVSGGSVCSMLLNEAVNDYDVYLMDRSVLKRLVIYYSRTFKEIVILDGKDKKNLESQLGIPDELGEDWLTSFLISVRNLKEDQIKLYFKGGLGSLKVNIDKKPEELNYSPVFFSPNAISLSNNLQIVIRFWGTPEEVHKTFDFIHATNYFTFETGLVRNLPAVESILTKQLRYQGSQYPLTSIIRAKKFIKRGFNISAGEYLKIMFQISQLDLNDPEVLEEQLIGVDIAYFGTIITALRNKYESTPDFQLSSDYLTVLVDRIFNEDTDLV